MKAKRKLSTTLKLKIPRKVRINGEEITLDGDNGNVINDRCYSYHPTKGWRSRNSTVNYGFNLTKYLIDHGRRKNA